MTSGERQLDILHVVALTGTPAFGGPSTVATDLSGALARRGHRVTLASGLLKGTVPEVVEGVETRAFPAIRVPTRGFTGVSSPALFTWLSRKVRRFDLVHVHAGRDLFSLGVLGICAARRALVVTQSHGMVPRAVTSPVRVADAVAFRRLITRAAANLALNTDEAEDLVALGCRTDRVTIVPNGVPLGELPARREPDRPTVLFCSRLHPRKRVLDFLEASARVLAAGHDARFVVAGPDEGDLPAALERMQQDDLRGRVDYAGPVDRPAALALMAGATVFVLPAVDEPFGLALVEAMAIGTPAICTTGCALAPALADEDAAVIVEPGEAGLAAALRELLADPARAEARGRRGAEVARRLFSIDAVAEQVDGIYRQVVARPRRRMS